METKGVKDLMSMMEKIASETEAFFLVLTLILFGDLFIYYLNGKNILRFDWDFGRGINRVGLILTFIGLFSFFMTVLGPLLRSVLGALSTALPPDWLVEDYKRLPGYVLTSDLRRRAMRENSAFLLELVKAREEAVSSHKAHVDRLGILAISALTMAAIDFFAGWTNKATVLWEFGSLSPNLASILGAIFIIVCFILIKESLKVPFVEHVYYPPLAEEQQREREKSEKS